MEELRDLIDALLFNNCVGMTAREIARTIKVPKRIVNSFLYRHRNKYERHSPEGGTRPIWTLTDTYFNDILFNGAQNAPNNPELHELNELKERFDALYWQKEKMEKEIQNIIDRIYELMSNNSVNVTETDCLRFSRNTKYDIKINSNVEDEIYELLLQHGYDCTVFSPELRSEYIISMLKDGNPAPQWIRGYIDYPPYDIKYEPYDVIEVEELNCPDDYDDEEDDEDENSVNEDDVDKAKDAEYDDNNDEDFDDNDEDNECSSCFRRRGEMCKSTGKQLCEDYIPIPDDVQAERESRFQQRIDDISRDEILRLKITPPSCDNCQLRKSEMCPSLGNEVCEDFKAIPYIDRITKDNWPKYGDARAAWLGELHNGIRKDP